MKRILTLALWVFALFLGIAAQAEQGLEKGIRLFEEKKWVGAQQFFESIIEKTPNHPLAAFYLGQIFFHQENYDQAVHWFSRSVELQDGHSDYHLWLGRAYGRRAERASIFMQPFLAIKVKNHFERAVTLDPGNMAARFDLAQYYLLAPGFLGGGWEKAREQAREIKKWDLPRGHEIWGMIYEAETEYQRAEKEYLAAIDLAPNNLDVYHQLASLYEKTNQDRKASKMLVEIREIERGQK